MPCYALPSNITNGTDHWSIIIVPTILIICSNVSFDCQQPLKNHLLSEAGGKGCHFQCFRWQWLKHMWQMHVCLVCFIWCRTKWSRHTCTNHMCGSAVVVFLHQSHHFTSLWFSHVLMSFSYFHLHQQGVCLCFHFNSFVHSLAIHFYNSFEQFILNSSF